MGTMRQYLLHQESRKPQLAYVADILISSSINMSSITSLSRCPSYSRCLLLSSLLNTGADATRMRRYIHIWRTWREYGNAESTSLQCVTLKNTNINIWLQPWRWR